jgi:hypothetical protein
MGQVSAINPTQIAIPELARLLSAASGQPVTEAMIQAAIDQGVPTMGGNVNLVNFLAWLEGKLGDKS